MTENRPTREPDDVYTIRTGDQVEQWFDPVTRELTYQTCVHCRRRHKAVKFSKRQNSPTGRSLKCYYCRREATKAKRRAAWAAAYAGQESICSTDSEVSNLDASKAAPPAA